jgi:hypothetical protein
MVNKTHYVLPLEFLVESLHSTPCPKGHMDTYDKNSTFFGCVIAPQERLLGDSIFWSEVAISVG